MQRSADGAVRDQPVSAAGQWGLGWSGRYRAAPQDLNPGFGDPRDQVSGQACDFLLACGIQNKE